MPEKEREQPSAGDETRTTKATAQTRRFEDLVVWRKAHALALAIYRSTRSFPAEERFGLISQMRRAAVSVAANIAEGAKKRTSRDQFHFYNIAQGSLEELRYYLMLSADLGYRSKDQDRLEEDLDRVARMLYGLAEARRT